MYILKIEDEREMKRAMELLENNGIKVSRESSYRVVTKEEVESVVESRYSELDEDIKDDVIAIASEDLYLKYDIFDNTLIDDVIGQTLNLVMRERE